MGHPCPPCENRQRPCPANDRRQRWRPALATARLLHQSIKNDTIARDKGKPFMRTTLTIEDDVAFRLAELRAEGGERFKIILNRVLRAGLAAIGKAKEIPSTHRFSTPTFHGKCLLPENMTSAHDMLAFGEG